VVKIAVREAGSLGAMCVCVGGLKITTARATEGGRVGGREGGKEGRREEGGVGGREEGGVGGREEGMEGWRLI
jgi:hypothetical protein